MDSTKLITDVIACAGKYLEYEIDGELKKGAVEVLHNALLGS